MQDQHLSHPAFQSRVVPVIVLSDAKQAVPLAQALLDGGIDVMEITLRSDVALDAIEAVARAVPQMHLGAGTVTRPSDVPRVIDAGARFALSPGCTDALVDAMRATGLPFIPGVMTPGEVMRARDQGFTLMKLFPAQQAGGIGMLKALGSVFADVRFCPTGGIDAATAPQFLALPNVACVGGSWIVPNDLVAGERWSEISELARQASALRNP